MSIPLEIRLYCLFSVVSILCLIFPILIVFFAMLSALYGAWLFVKLAKGDKRR